MCEAATAITVGTMLVGAAMKARAQAQAGAAQANILEGNAVLADRAGSDAVSRGEFGAQRVALRGGHVGSAQQAAYAAAGVDTKSGSPTAVAGDTTALTALDAAIVKNNATREALGFATQAGQFREQAKYTRSAASGAAMQTILGGVAGAATRTIPMLKIAGQGEDIGDGSYGGAFFPDEAD